MPVHTLDADNGLYYEHVPSAGASKPTFVFVNALTGNTQAWEAHVAPRLRESGYGTLCYNFRGQDGSPFDTGIALTPKLIVDDLHNLLKALEPESPILVGLSIGGLFAAQAWLGGASARGLVLLNTLREIGPRISWVNDAMPKLVAAGGVRLLLDAIFPLLVNEEFAQAARPGFLQDLPYEPLDPEHGHLNLMRHARVADWAIEYSRLHLPTLVITGLQDRVFLDRDVVERLYDSLPDARREDWPDAGHLLPLECPDRLAATLARFGSEIEQAGV